MHAYLFDILNSVFEIQKLRQVKSESDKAKMPVMARRSLEAKERSNLKLAHTLQIALLRQLGSAQNEIVERILTDEAEEVVQPFVRHRDYQSFFNEQIYRDLLPICQLAYTFEKDGIAEEHASKLAILFDSTHKALDYLIKHQAINKKLPHPVHDACLFDLPDKHATFKTWKWFANKHNMMLNPGFRTLLPHASEIENVYQEMHQKMEEVVLRNSKKEVSAIRDEKKETKILYSDVNAIISEISKRDVSTENTIKKIFKVYQKLVSLQVIQHFTASQHSLSEASIIRDDLRNDLLIDFVKSAYRLSLKLSRLSGLDKFEDTDFTSLQAFYEYYQSKTVDGHKILVRHGISKDKITKFQQLTPKQDDQIMPDIVIDGESIGYPGYYLEKLDVTQSKGAALAAVLGKMTNCCQYFGGVGEACTIHGIESAYSDFYVLRQGKVNNRNITDPILAQSWVWRGKNQNLCADSIETTEQANDDMVADFYRYFAHRVCQKQSSDTYNEVNTFNTGEGSGITSYVANENYPASVDYFMDYHGYNDSQAQLPLAAKQLPYLMYGLCHSEQLKEIIAQDTRSYLDRLLDGEQDISQNAQLLQAIAFCLQSNNDELLALIRELANEKDQLAPLNRIIDFNDRYLSLLDDDIIDLEFIRNGVFLNLQNQYGQTALHLAVFQNNKALVEQLIDAGIDINARDSFGNTPLINAVEKMDYRANKIEIDDDIAKLIIDRGAALDIKDRDENTALNIAVKDNNLALVQHLVDKGANIEVENADLKTAIFLAAENGYLEIFRFLYAKNARFNLVSYEYEDSLFLKAIESGNKEIVEILLKKPDIDFKKTNNEGETIFHKAAPHPDMLKLILPLYPEDKRFEAVCELDKHGKIPLHNAISSPESMGIILSLYPEKLRLSVAKIKDKTILHHADAHPEHLKVILELLPKEQRFTVVKMTDRRHKTVLHDAAKSHPESLRVILTSLPKDKIYEAARLADFAYANTVLHTAAKNPESLKIILTLLPIDKRLEAIKIPNTRSKTVLHVARRHPESIKTIFELLPENQRLEAAIGKYSNHNTFLIYAAQSNPEYIEMILDLLPENQRLEAVLDKNRYDGKTFLDLIANDDNSLQIILKLLPENHRFDFLNTTAGEKRVADILRSSAFDIEDSFVSEYLNLYTVVRKIDSLASERLFAYMPPNVDLSLFSYLSKNNLQQLKQGFLSANSYEDAKKAIYRYLEDDENQISDIGKELLPLIGYTQKGNPVPSA